MDLKRGLTGKALFVPSPCFLMRFSSVGRRNYCACSPRKNNWGLLVREEREEGGVGGGVTPQKLIIVSLSLSLR